MIKKPLLLTALSACALFSSHQQATAQACPNGDFENWLTHAYTEPDSGWNTTNNLSLSSEDSLTVWPVTGHSGQAAHIQTAVIGTDTMAGELVLGCPTYNLQYVHPTTGGVPYTQLPWVVTGWYRYNLPGNDSAFIEIVFKKAGAVLMDTVYKFRGTGTLSTFTAFNFPIFLSDIPDSIVIAAAPSNIHGHGVEAGSWLELDDLAFAGPGVTQPIPGGTFNNWTSSVYERPEGWHTLRFGDGTAVAKSTIHRSGSYSVQLTTKPQTPLSMGGTVAPGLLTTGALSFWFNNTPAATYTDTFGVIAGYYMYQPTGSDSAQMIVNVMNGSTLTGANIRNFKPAASWTFFEVPFHCANTPDKLLVSFTSGDPFGGAGSVLRLDSLYFTTTPVLGVAGTQLTPGDVRVYPNPAGDDLHIQFGRAPQGSVEVRLYDMLGQVVAEQAYEACPAAISLPVRNLAKGMYFYEVRNNGAIARDRFLKD